MWLQRFQCNARQHAIKKNTLTSLVYATQYLVDSCKTETIQIEMVLSQHHLSSGQDNTIDMGAPSMDASASIPPTPQPGLFSDRGGEDKGERCWRPFWFYYVTLALFFRKHGGSNAFLGGPGAGRHPKRTWLALNKALAPAQHAEAVDHCGVGVGADETVRVHETLGVEHHPVGWAGRG